jgi:hypothetical protein
MDDIVFYSAYFYFEMPVVADGTVSLIEAQSTYYTLRLALPERISIG